MMAALQLINGRTDILALGFFRTDAEIGIFRVASQMAAVVVFALQAVNTIQGPHIAHLFAKGDMHKLQTMITRSAQGIMLFAVPVVIVIVIFGEFIIRTVFGPEYESAYIPLVILCVGQLVNASMGSVGSLLNMTGHERDTTKSILIAAIVNVTLNLSLVPVWGIIWRRRGNRLHLDRLELDHVAQGPHANRHRTFACSSGAAPELRIADHARLRVEPA